LSDFKAEWKGDKPVFLVIREYEQFTDRGGKPAMKAHSTVIDLDEGGWVEKHKGLMRKPGAWMLCGKKASVEKGMLMPILMMQVDEGEQPYYTTKHVGIMSFGMDKGPESVTYGIGKKHRDGSVMRLWLLPNGSIAGGEDVYWLADRMNKGKL
jgi:hypothetical protein